MLDWVRGDDLWVWGGLNAMGVEQTGVYCYNFRKDQWDTEVPLPSARYNSFGASSGRGLYVLGGLHGSTILNAVNGWGLPCYANCDGSTTSPQLNVNDFVCYLNKLADDVGQDDPTIR